MEREKKDQDVKMKEIKEQNQIISKDNIQKKNKNEAMS